MNMKRTFITLSILAAMATQGGNPVRSGSAGAPELLINPWALTAGWAEANTANVMGLESLYGNVAGLAYVDKFQFGLANTQWLVGTGIQFNTAAFASPTGNGGVLGVHISNMNYGEIEVTTTELPDGGAGYFKPTSSIIGIGYAKQFTNSIYGGINIKMYNSSMSNLTATGMCFDAGIEYVTGEDDDFRFGITLRNIGPSFGYSGDGMSIILPVPTGSHSSSFQSSTEDFELPTQLSIACLSVLTSAEITALRLQEISFPTPSRRISSLLHLSMASKAYLLSEWVTQHLTTDLTAWQLRPWRDLLQALASTLKRAMAGA